MEILQTIWDFIAGYVTLGNALWAAITILGLIAAKTGLDFVNEIRDIVQAYRDAKRKSSPGGSDVTDTEQAEINAEIAEAVDAAWDRYKNTIFDLLGRLFGKFAFWQ